MIISEEEKNRIRGLHKNFSIIKEQDDLTDTEKEVLEFDGCPGPECPSCLPCALEALKGYNPGFMGFGAGNFDYTNLGNELLLDIMAIYLGGSTDPIVLAEKLGKLYVKYSKTAPMLVKDGPIIIQNLYNNICTDIDTGDSLETNAFGLCLPTDIFDNIPTFPYQS